MNWTNFNITIISQGIMRIVLAHSDTANHSKLCERDKFIPVILHTNDGSVKTSLLVWRNINKNLVKVRGEQHVYLPECDVALAKLINDLLERKELMVDNAIRFKMVKQLQILGCEVKKIGNHLEVNMGNKRLGNQIISSKDECDLCDLVVFRSPSEDGTVLLDRCPCNSNDLDGLDMGYTDVIDQLYRKKKHKPLKSNSNHPALNGELTTTERNNNAQIILTKGLKRKLPKKYRTAIIKSIKLGNLPIISMHDLSLALDRIPSLGKNSKDFHICIFCQAIEKGRIALLNHVQKIHTGCLIKCDVCEVRKTSEYLLSRHKSRCHGDRKNQRFFCKFARFRYNDESLRIGRLAFKKNYDGPIGQKD